jgi:uncharacterized cupredoxin-like copper-binding protein
MRLTALVRATLIGLALAGVACSGGGTAVHATLKDDSITIDPDSTAAGKISFDIRNDGTMTHEFEIFRTDLAPDALPTDGDVVDGGGLPAIDEIEDVAPGTSAQLNVDLSPGSYVMICNLPGHYSKGMHSGFTVT